MVLVEGEAGIGKSTIWAEACARATATGSLVLAARASETESALTLATLTDLLEDVDAARFDALPEPQRTAILAALLRVDSPTTSSDSRVLGTALRNVLEPLAADRPVVLAIDDVQWMDLASAQVLAFGLRRMAGARVAMLASRRTPLPLPHALDDVASDVGRVRVQVGPLSVGALQLLLRQRGAAPSRSTLIRIHEASDGNPLFALEIARLLDEVGAPPAGEPLPVPDDVRELLQRRLAALDAPVLEVLLETALLGRATVERLRGSAGRSVHSELTVARDQDLIRVADVEARDAVVTFAHPLHAAAVLRVMPPKARREAHARLAASADGLDERARHAALASAEPNEAVASQLEQAGRDAIGRAAPTAAAELLSLAVDRTPPDLAGARADRQVALGVALVRAGETGEALRVFEAVAGGPEPLARARARLELAAIHYDTDGSTAAAARLCEEAIVDAAGDPQVLALAWAMLATVDYEDLARKRRAIAEAARIVREHPEIAGPTQAMVVLQGTAATFIDTGRLDPDGVREGLRLDSVEPAANVSARFGAALGTWLKDSDDLDGAGTWLRATLAAAEAEGDESSLPFALGHLAQLTLLTGAWSESEAFARRHLDVATELEVPGQRRAALMNLAAVDAHTGRLERAREHITEALPPALAEDDHWTSSRLLSVLGLVELSAGNPAAAVRALERSAAVRALVPGNPPRKGAADLAEALVALGRLDDAEVAVAALEADANRLGWPSLVARALRARGLLLAAHGAIAEADSALERAMSAHDRVAIPFERGRTLLALGQVRRRRRERSAARDAFADSLAIFEQLGAPGWVARVEAELARTGIRRGSGSELTESERRVAELAAAGHTNREVAAALFMSPKTVGANLARAYTKLGINSRAELGAVIARRTQT